MAGTVLIIIGVAFLLKNLGVISSGTWGFIWPALLVALGAWFLAGRRVWRRDGTISLDERLGIWRRK